MRSIILFNHLDACPAGGGKCTCGAAISRSRPAVRSVRRFSSPRIALNKSHGISETESGRVRACATHHWPSTRYGYPLFPPFIWTRAGLQSLERVLGTRCTLAMANASLSTSFDLKGRLAAVLVFDHRDIAQLKAQRLVGAESGIGGEQIMHAFPRRLVKLLLLSRGKPCSTRNLRRRAIWLWNLR